MSHPGTAFWKFYLCVLTGLSAIHSGEGLEDCVRGSPRNVSGDQYFMSGVGDVLLLVFTLRLVTIPIRHAVLFSVRTSKSTQVFFIVS